MENKQFNLKKKREELFEQCKENYENSYGLTKGATDWSSIDWIIKEVLRCVEIQDYEFIKGLKEYQDKKIKLAKENNEVDKVIRETHIDCCIDTKMFIDKLAGDKMKAKRRRTTSIRISRSHKK